jgi:2-phospho-L-lactate transferase/gluconeogenesis factor (CofD/UPF0052 family)
MKQPEYYDNPMAHPYAEALREISVTLVGGGGGTTKAAEALAPYVRELNADVSVSDSGGATIKNTREHDVPPSGDISRVTWGLSRFKPQLTRFEGKHARFDDNDGAETVRSVGRQMIHGLEKAGKKVGYEFDTDLGLKVVDQTVEVAKMAVGGIGGRKLSGLMYTALMSKKLMGHHVNKATEIMGHIVGAQGNIYAVTDTIHDIVATYYDPELGRIVRLKTEDDIDREGIPYPMATTLSFDRKLNVNAKAEDVAENSDYTLFSQGSPWGSLLAAGMPLKDALQRRAAAGRLTGGILNLTEDNGSVGITADQHAEIMEKHLGVTFDTSIYNTNTEAITAPDVPVRGTPSVRYAIGARLTGKVAEYSANDAVAAAGLRSKFETDPRALALAMMDLVQMQHENTSVTA